VPEEELIQTSRVSTKRIDDFLAQSTIGFTTKSTSESDERSSMDEMEVGVSESAEVHVTAAADEQFSMPHAEEESIVPQSKRKEIILPELTDTSAKVEAKTKKSGGILGFFRRKNGDRNSSVESPKIKSNSLDKRTAAQQQHLVETKSRGSTLPADSKKDKNSGGGGRFHVGFGFGFGGKGKHGSGSTSPEDHSGASPKGQTSQTNSSSPSKSNIRVFQIMSGQQNGGTDAGVETKQLAPPTRPEGPLLVESPPMTSVTSVTSERPLPVVDVHVSASSPSSVPAISSQYMVAVAIDFGRLPFSRSFQLFCL